MKLQTKTLLSFIALLMAMLLVVSLFATFIVLSSYTALERQYITKDLDLAEKKITDEETTLSALVSDWGPWDDSYSFVLGRKPDYIETNLLPDTYNNLRLNLVVITDTKGDIVYQGAYDLENRTMVTPPAWIASAVAPGSPLMNLSDPRHSTSGILMTPTYPMLIASRPIVHTDFSGIPVGVMIMGRYLDPDEIRRLAELTQPDLGFSRPDDSGLPPDLLTRLSETGDGSRFLVLPRNNGSVEGFALLTDVSGRDALVLHFTEPRTIYNEGYLTILNFIFIILGTGLGFGLVIILMLDRLVLSRLDALNREVHSISVDHAVDHRVEIGGDDEFAALAGQINQMLTALQQTQQGLVASETRFRELAGLLPQIIFEMDPDGRLRYINRAGAEQFGITDRDIAAGTSIHAFVAPEDLVQMQRGLASVMGGAPSPGDVYHLRRPDGSIMKAIVSTSLIRRDGTVTGFRGIVVDITDRLRLAEQLEESTNLLKGILRASPVGVFQLDEGGRVTFVNETFTTISGIPMEKIQGRYWADILPEEERHRVLAEVDAAVSERRTAATEFRYIHPDGMPYWLFGQTVPLISAAGTLTGWVGTITDISRQKTAEDALRESEEKYRALTENTPDILFSTDMLGVITYASPQVNKYGYLAEEVVGQPLDRFIHPQDLPQVKSNMAKELKDGAQFLSRFRIVDKWGTPYWFDEKSTLRLDLEGTPVGLYGILRDVTERKRVEDAIDIANKKLNLMNQITRHDILNTITGLLGCVDMARATSSVPEKDQLLEEIRELTRVIQRHITFTRMYQEVGVHLPQWQNVNDLIARAVQNFAGSGLTFRLEFEKTEVYADPLLEKVFYNLIDNAVRYGEKLTTIAIYPVVSDSGFSIVFEDDGIGVPDGQKKEIFKRGVGKNTGMGLFLTAEILAITGITIEENGVSGKGARFEIRIPNGTWRLPRG